MFWQNALRAIIALVCLLSLAIMLNSFIKYHETWNTKTRDYWYARMIWTISGLSACIEGIIRDLPMRYTFVFVFAASVITLKGNLKKGQWGGVRE